MMWWEWMPKESIKKKRGIKREGGLWKDAENWDVLCN